MLPLSLFVSCPPSTSITICDQMHAGEWVWNGESTWKSSSSSSMVNYTPPPLQNDLDIIFSFYTCYLTPFCCMPEASQRASPHPSNSYIQGITKTMNTGVREHVKVLQYLVTTVSPMLWYNSLLPLHFPCVTVTAGWITLRCHLLPQPTSLFSLLHWKSLTLSKASELLSQDLIASSHFPWPCLFTLSWNGFGTPCAVGHKPNLQPSQHGFICHMG